MSISLRVTRGYTFASGVPFSIDDLNAAALPSIELVGDIDASGELAPGSINKTLVKPDNYWYAADTGVVNAYVADPDPAATDLEDGLLVYVKIANRSTSTAPTLNVNSLGAKTIKRANGEAVRPGDLLPNNVHGFQYNTTGPCWELLNPGEPPIHYGSSGGSTSAITATTAPTLVNLYEGAAVHIEAPYEPEGAAQTFLANVTLNVDGSGAKKLRKANDQPLAEGDLKSGQEIIAVYRAKGAEGIGGWMMVNTDVQMPALGTAFQVVRTNADADARENADPTHLQVVRLVNASVITVTTVKQVDDSPITQASVHIYDQQSFTPMSDSSKILVEAKIVVGNKDTSDPTDVVGALFIDSEDAFAAGTIYLYAGSGATHGGTLEIIGQINSPGTDPITIKVGLFYGNSDCSGIEINGLTLSGSGSGLNFGGIMYSMLRITEYLP